MSKSILTVVMLLQVIPGHVLAQTSSGEAHVELSGSFGWGGLSRFGDSTPFGSGLSVGGRLGVRPLDRLGLGFEVHGMTGMKENVKSAMVFSGIATFDLSTSDRARPYVLGGIGMMRTNNRATTYVVRQSVTNFTDVGSGLVMGLGARVFLTPQVSLRPELTYINALWNSTENLSETRASMAVGYQW